jgi:hypothetical protein
MVPPPHPPFVFSHAMVVSDEASFAVPETSEDKVREENTGTSATVGLGVGEGEGLAVEPVLDVLEQFTKRMAVIRVRIAIEIVVLDI